MNWRVPIIVVAGAALVAVLAWVLLSGKGPAMRRDLVTPADELPTPTPAPEQQVVLLFIGRDGRLHPELRQVPLPKQVDARARVVVSELLANRRLHSIGAFTDAGQLVGHMGITLRPHGGITADAGMTLVDPTFRGRGIARRVAVGLAEQSMALGLVGVHDYPVTVHAATQRIGAGFGVDTGLMLANKVDAPGASDRFEMLREMFSERVRIEPMSTNSADDMARLRKLLFRLLRVIRVYAKPPGKKPDLDDPFVLPLGKDVLALARKVYHGQEDRVRSARIWGHGVVDGQQVHLDHVLHDGDIVELHG